MRKEAKIRKEANLKQNSDGVKFDPSEKGRTAETVAKKIGVSKNTYKAMKQIVSEGTKEQIERMDKGGFDNIDVLLIDDIHFITAHKNTRSNK